MQTAKSLPEQQIVSFSLFQAVLRISKVFKKILYKICSAKTSGKVASANVELDWTIVVPNATIVAMEKQPPAAMLTLLKLTRQLLMSKMLKAPNSKILGNWRLENIEKSTQ